MKNTHAFTPPRYLRNAHIQSALNSLGPRKIRANRLADKLNSEYLILETADGVRLAAEYDLSTARKAPSKEALVIMIHGWEGSSRSAYQVTTAKYLLDHGFDVLRINMRDHGDTQHLNKELFNSTMTPEVADAIGVFLRQHSYPSVFLVGFSLGGNFSLRIAADSGKTLGLTAVVAISPPVDPVNAMATLNQGSFIYRKYFMRRWKSSLRKKLQHFPEYDFAKELENNKTFDELNKFFVPRYTDFADTESYFKSYALTGDRLSKLDTPAHLITAEDDPVIPITDLDKITCQNKLKLEVYRFGGHCGFIANCKAHSFMEPRLVDLFNGYLDCADN
jgi:predicted alpha/beta-fold hydrolase